jgi:WD40 repeat protein/tRNA A-37 threonylcarbamoyl transferase component Bud32
MRGVDCVSEADLRALLLGDLPDPVSRLVLHHLENCPECEATAQRLESCTDTFLGSLRQVVHDQGELCQTVVMPESGATAGQVELLGLEAPPRLAGYEIVGELGRGGMSVVYKARQLGPGRVVALKVLLGGAHAATERRARLLAEADAIARLQHPHIVQIHEASHDDGLLFLALEFMGGGSLAKQLDGRAQPPVQAAALMETLARAVHYAHQCGVIHRDLKPTNILLTADGIPKITDFGLAKYDRNDLTATGEMLGTPSYMAPEQAAGDNRAVGPAADVYGLGSVLFELLTGRPPFRAETVLAALEQVRSREVTSPSLVQPGLPRDLCTICLTCLQKEPTRRYASAADLAEDLRRFQAGESIAARPMGTPERCWRWCRRNPGWAAMLAGVAGLLVVVAVVSTVLALGLDAEAAKARRAERNANEKLYRSLLAEAQASRWSGRPGQQHNGLAALREAVSLIAPLGLDQLALSQMRSEAIACKALTDLRVIEQWPAEHPFWNSEVAWDADLKRYTSCDPKGIVRVRQAGSGTEVVHLPPPNVPVAFVVPCFSPNGRFLAVTYWTEGGEARALVWDLIGGHAAVQFPASQGIRVLGFDPDSRHVVAARGDGPLGLWDLCSGAEKRLQGGFRAERIAFHPNGRQLAYTGRALAEVGILDLDTGTVVKRLPHPAEVWTLAWSPDGRLMAAGCEDRKVHVWDTWHWHEQAVLEGHHRPVSAVAFSPAGDVLASSSLDGTTFLWDPVGGIALLSAAGRCLGFSRSDGRVAFQRGVQMGIWELVRGMACRQLRYGRAGNRKFQHSIVSIEDVDFCSDGRLMAASGNDGIHFWDVSIGSEIGFLPVGRQETIFFDSKGTRLFTYGRVGLHCWPIVPDLLTPSVLRIGPPQRLDVPANKQYLRAAQARSGQLLAINNDAHTAVVLLDTAQLSTKAIARGLRVTKFDLSPDGRWLALHGVDVRVLDIAGDRFLEPSPPGMAERAHARVAFSPDGRWLVAGRQRDFLVWPVGQWAENPLTLPRENTGDGEGALAFSRDSRLLAITRTPAEVQLIDLASFTEVARLLAPDARAIDCMRFSPDGSQLAVATQNHVIQLWDLRTICRDLHKMDLNWELPAYAPKTSSPGPLQVMLFPDRLEAENLLVADAEKCRWQMRDTSPRGQGAWSNDRELVGLAEQNGYLEVELDAPRTGNYTLGITFTQAPDLGVVEVRFDGSRVGPPFDCFAEKVVRCEQPAVGRLALAAGRHRLRFTAVSKNPRASGYHFAVDCLRLLPEGN